MRGIKSMLPQRSPTPFMVPWAWSAPTWMAAWALATARPQSLWVDADFHRRLLTHGFGRLRDELGHRAAVGIAEREHRCAGFLGGEEGLQRVVGVGAEGVEEVL